MKKRTRDDVAVDLSGRTFTRLKIIERLDKRKYKNYVWLCQCVCGNRIEVPTNQLTSQNVRSCGCLMAEKLREAYESTRKNGVVTSTLTQKISSKNTSGVKGVAWDKGRNNWMAYINIKRKRINLGRFATLEEAAQARKEAEKKYHKPYLEN